MKHLLGIAAIVSCIIMSTFATFLDNPINNVALWGVVISIIYMVLTNLQKRSS